MAEIIKINDNTWRIEDDFVRFFVLKGERQAVLIDSGVNSVNAREIAENLTGLPVILFNTHGDGDHVSGTGAFDAIHICKADYEGCGVDKRFPETKLIDVFDGDTYNLGNRHLEIITIPGHTKGSIAVLDIENRLLFAGDSVQTGFIYMFGEKRVPDEYPASLKKLIGRIDEFDSVVASHGEPILPNDSIIKVLSAWENVISGKVPYEMINLYGTEVKAYNAGDCGFYC